MTNIRFRITPSAFAWLFRQKEWVAKTLLFWLIYLIPLINLLVNGYMMRVIRNSINDEELPDWKDIRGLIHFTYGNLIITLGYVIIAIIAGVVGCYVFSMIPKIGLACSIAWVLLVFIVSQLFSFVGMIRFVKWDKFGEAFAFKQILLIVKKAFVQLCLLALPLIGIMILITYVGFLITGENRIFISIIIAPFVYWSMTTFAYFGTKIYLSVDPNTQTTYHNDGALAEESL